ncbi:MAG TPA: IS5 family transposase [Burkholderiaceae bacterium]|jgi:IS5 family transposase|nr:IS5 family transposase [Burkholderiaceae bacterium]
MSQLSFAEAEYAAKKRTTRREAFLQQMDGLIPWSELEARIAPHDAKGSQGRPPYPLSVMLRVHCLQLFYNLSDPALEDALYEVESMRRFAGVKLDRLPDETTILNFRHLLESHGLGKELFAAINAHLASRGLMLRAGTILDATVIAAPSSTKYHAAARDCEMHQTRKGKNWHFGMKLHIGADDAVGLVHSVVTTAANEADINVAERLLHGDEREVWADAGYRGLDKRQSQRSVAWHIALAAGKRAALAPDDPRAVAERAQARVRAKVEHPFRYVKQVFGYAKVRYRGLAKNMNRLYVLLGLANLLIGRRYLVA